MRVFVFVCAKKHRIEHEVLNAKHHEREAQVIAKAGRPGAVTIATIVVLLTAIDEVGNSATHKSVFVPTYSQIANIESFQSVRVADNS